MLTILNEISIFTHFSLSFVRIEERRSNILEIRHRNDEIKTMANMILTTK